MAASVVIPEMSTVSALAAFPEISPTLAAGIVPEEMLLAFKLVRDAPEPLNVVAVQVPVTSRPPFAFKF